MSRKIGINFLLLTPLFLLLISLGGIYYWWHQNTTTLGNPGLDLIEFVIEDGESVNSILTRLEQKKIIPSATAGKIYLKLNKLEKKIQAGEYFLPLNMGLDQILKQLQHGKSEQVLTIPEGFRLEQVSSRLCQLGFLCEEGYDSLLLSLKQKIGEGNFFPDTYFLDKNTDISNLAVIISENKKNKADFLQTKSILKNGFSAEETVILASLLEREALNDEERPIIAGILFNRLDNDWRLQIDATVQYIIGCQNEPKNNCISKDWWPKDLTIEDLAVQSSYNTYQNKGLPPAPICSPGLSSLQAVYNPVKTEYFYYLHDKNGQVHYAETLEEHNVNFDKYLD